MQNQPRVPKSPEADFLGILALVHRRLIIFLYFVFALIGFCLLLCDFLGASFWSVFIHIF